MFLFITKQLKMVDTSEGEDSDLAQALRGGISTCLHAAPSHSRDRPYKRRIPKCIVKHPQNDAGRGCPYVLLTACFGRQIPSVRARSRRRPPLGTAGSHPGQLPTTPVSRGLAHLDLERLCCLQLLLVQLLLVQLLQHLLLLLWQGLTQSMWTPVSLASPSTGFTVSS